MRSAYVALAFAVSVGACGRRGERDQRADLARDIEIELNRSGVDGVEVSIDEHSATLTGLVPTASERARAELVAKETAGARVMRIENRVAIARPPVLTSASAESRAAAQIEMRARSLGLHDVRVRVERGAFVVHGAVPLGKHDDLMGIAAEEALPTYHVVDDTHVD